MTISIDEADPCAAAVALRQIYVRLVAGEGAMEVRFRAGSNGVERAVTYHRAHPDRLLAVIRGFEEELRARSGPRPAALCALGQEGCDDGTARYRTAHPAATGQQAPLVATGPTLAQIAGRVLNRPLLLHPDKADLILHVLQGRIGIEPLQPLTPETNRFVGSHRRDNGSVSSMRVANGVAILPIVGSLVNRGAWIGANSGLVSYEGIAAQLREAEADPDVRAILLDIDSPGGEATGMFATANLVRAVNEVKPVVAFVNDVAASAAYGIASAAREIVVSPTSMVGSIGVVLTHLDRSGELEDRGVKPTLIHAGAHKVDGHPFGPLSDAVRADLQAEVMKVYDQFVGLVAEGGPGRISADAIRATEARTYLGADAVAARARRSHGEPRRGDRRTFSTALRGQTRQEGRKP